MSRMVKVAVPVLLGVGSVRVYAMAEGKSEKLLSPQQLSIYPPQERRCYTEEQPGALQRGFGSVRGSLQPYVHKIKSAVISVKVTTVNLYHAGEDVYHFLKDPPPGFVPRLALISVSALAGVILARKGSRLKKLGLPLSLAAVGFGVCYPAQAVTVLKVKRCVMEMICAVQSLCLQHALASVCVCVCVCVCVWCVVQLSGRKVYAASQWTGSTVASLWKSSAPAAAPERTESAGPSESVSGTGSHDLTAETSATEQVLREVPPKSEPSLTSEDQVFVPDEQTSPAKDFLVVNTEGKRSNRRPEEPTEKIQTPPAVQEKRGHKEAQQLMDFGQSNPEDADLYSTRS